MANVHTPDRHEIPGPDIQVLDRRAEKRRAPDANLFRRAGHRPELGRTLGDLWVESFARGILDHKLKEMTRDCRGGITTPFPLYDGPP